MAVFLVNTCKFNKCGQTFSTLTQLIRHIEDTHLDFDERSVEQYESQHPQALPISYILRVFTERCAKESMGVSSASSVSCNVANRCHSPNVSVCSSPPTGSEVEEEDNESDSRASIDSLVTINVEKQSQANTILKIMSPSCTPCPSNTSCLSTTDSKPFICAINGCNKCYRNINGLRYHKRMVHKTTINGNSVQKKDFTGATKVYKCECGKLYKTSHGLKNHQNIHHSEHSVSQKCSKSKPESVSNSKESMLATFVRMKSLPSSNKSSTSSSIQVNRNGVEGFPLMFTLKTETENKQDKNDEQISEITSRDLTQNTAVKCPLITAPTLQQHLLSPIISKSNITLTKIV